MNTAPVKPALLTVSWASCPCQGGHRRKWRTVWTCRTWNNHPCFKTSSVLWCHTGTFLCIKFQREMPFVCKKGECEHNLTWTMCMWLLAGLRLKKAFFPSQALSALYVYLMCAVFCSTEGTKSDSFKSELDCLSILLQQLPSITRSSWADLHSLTCGYDSW